MTKEELQAKENWTKEDYQHSLEFLRDNKNLADELYYTLKNKLFKGILSFDAGWPELFEDLDDGTKIAYQEAFKRL